MMPPIFAIVAFGLLIAYPLVQIAAIRTRRPLRLAFNSLIADLRADEAYQDDEEQAALSGLMEESRGSPINVLAPIALPIVAIAEILAGDSGSADREISARDLGRTFKHLDRLRPASKLWEDPRLVKAVDMAIQLSFAAWPITIAVALCCAIPFALVAAGVAWIRDRTTDIVSIREAKLKLAQVLHVMAYH